MDIGRLLAKRFRPMSRALKEFRLNDRTARAKLPQREKPYWRLISEGRHIGYRVGKTGASWVVRFREVGLVENYVVEKIGVPDDRVEADGVQILSWKQALEKANAWIAAKTAHPSEDLPSVGLEAATPTPLAAAANKLIALARSPHPGLAGPAMRYKIVTASAAETPKGLGGAKRNRARSHRRREMPKTGAAPSILMRRRPDQAAGASSS